MPVPGLSTKGTGAARRDVLALISVRRAADEGAPPLDADAIAERLFGKALPAPEAYGARPSDTPEPALETLLAGFRSEEHTSELPSLMRSSYAVFCLKKKKQ